MKLSLVVMTAGKQEGKVLAIPLAQFVIGRDPQCHLRPSSPLISKRHCAIVQRDGKAFIHDFDSTNGTFVNDQPVKGEAELKDGDRLKAGPLLFTVRLASSAAPVDQATPRPPTKGAAPKPAPAKEAAKAPAPASGGANDDEVAAMLLSLQDDGGGGSSLVGSGEVPDGSTVMEMVVPPGVDGAPPPPEKGKDKEKDKVKASGNTASAAKSILEQYMKRPRT
jgi:pSer/pThr/pTyr-binding forkhead associated (FHA) protein